MNPKTVQKIRSPQPCFGTWLSLGSPVVGELAAECGFDWLLVDMEHGCLSESTVLPMLQAIGPRRVAVVVRVPSHDAGVISRVLDWGADGVMVPHVGTAEEAAVLVRAMRYPPGGTRGYSRTVRAYNYGLSAPEANGSPLLFAQIESTEGIENVEEIAGVEGVDVLFVGPADLKLSLSTESTAPGFEEALERVVVAARAYGIHAGILIRDQKETAALLGQGFSKVAINSDLSMLRTGFLLALQGQPDMACIYRHVSNEQLG